MNELERLCPDDPAARAHVLEQRDMQGRTLLMQAAVKNHSQIMERLIQLGANVHYISPSREAPGGALHEAAARGHEAAVELLLAAGVNPWAANAAGRTALEEAALAGNTGVVRTLGTHAVYCGRVAAKSYAVGGMSFLYKEYWAVLAPYYPYGSEGTPAMSVRSTAAAGGASGVRQCLWFLKDRTAIRVDSAAGEVLCVRRCLRLFKDRTAIGNNNVRVSTCETRTKSTLVYYHGGGLRLCDLPGVLGRASIYVVHMIVHNTQATYRWNIYVLKDDLVKMTRISVRPADPTAQSAADYHGLIQALNPRATLPAAPARHLPPPPPGGNGQQGQPPLKPTLLASQPRTRAGGAIGAQQQGGGGQGQGQGHVAIEGMHALLGETDPTARRASAISAETSHAQDNLPPVAAAATPHSGYPILGALSTGSQRNIAPSASPAAADQAHQASCCMGQAAAAPPPPRPPPPEGGVGVGVKSGWSYSHVPSPSVGVLAVDDDDAAPSAPLAPPELLLPLQPSSAPQLGPAASSSAPQLVIDPSLRPTPPLGSTPAAGAHSRTGRPHPDPDPDGDMCVICLSEPREAGFLHGTTVHRCVCRGCSEHVAVGAPCPLCRQPVERVVLGVY